jgi:hypothetical protein
MKIFIAGITGVIVGLTLLNINYFAMALWFTDH